MKQNTQEWLEFRKTKIGASDAPVILGMSPWKTPLQLWEEKLGIRPMQEINEAMQRGHNLEPIAREAYINHTGNYCVPEVVTHAEYDWMIASLDGIAFDRSIIIEIKCPGKNDHHTASLGKVPEKYYAQLQHQLAVIGLDRLHYFSFRSEDDFYLIEIERDEKFINELISKEKDFWDKLQNFIEPDLNERDYIRKEDSVWESLSSRWIKASQELKRLEKEEKECREALLSSAEGKSCIGGGIRLTKSFRKGAVDYKKIPELVGIDTDKYRKASSEMWRISVE